MSTSNDDLVRLRPPRPQLRPADLVGRSVREVAEALAMNLSILVGQRARIVDYSEDELRRRALDALAQGAALAAAVDSSRWITACEALLAGATLEQLGVALELEGGEVALAVRAWADGQRELNSRHPDMGMVPHEHERVGQVVAAAVATVTGTPR